MKIVITINDDIYEDYLKQGATLPKYGTAINNLYEALWNGTPLPEQQPCDDCVSRQAAIEVIYDEYYDNAIAHDIVGMLFDLPSVKPQRPQGKWIEQNDTSKHHFGWYYCSNCGAYLMSADGANYCSCCGTETGGLLAGGKVPEARGSDDVQGGGAECRIV